MIREKEKCLTRFLNMSELNEIQKKVLNFLSKSPLAKKFYFTGGALLGAHYLHHRKSKDLDFFSDEAVSYGEALKFIEELKKELRLDKVKEKKIYDRHEFFISNGNEVRMEFVYYNHPKIKRRKKWDGVFIDSLDDIAANKLMAFFDRNEPKDLFDLYFLITREGYKIQKLLKLVEKKFGVTFSKTAVFSEAYKALNDLDNLKPLLLVSNNKEADKLIKEIKDYFISNSTSLLSGLLK